MWDEFSKFDRQAFFTKDFIHAFYCPLKVAKYHNHRFFELVYVVSGTAVHKTDTDVREITVGDYMFMDYSTFHEYKAVTDDFAVINCLFLSKCIDKSLNDCTDFNQLLKSYHLRLNKVVLYDAPINRFFRDESGDIGRILHRMCEERTARKTGYVDYMRSLLIQIIIETVRSVSTEVGESYSAPVLRVVTEIEENYFKKLKLSDIAAELFMSVPYLSTKFKEETGVCFGDYLKQVRIQWACMMLNSTEQNIDKIAEAVGYSDYKRFGEVFRELTGTSPGRFRAMSRS